MAPAILIVAALAAGLLPEDVISDGALFTLRLSLIVRAIVSLLPPDGRDILLATARDAVGRMRGLRPTRRVA